MEEGHPQISLPTLGTHYELNSLLSLNTIGRKSSRQSEFSVAMSEKSYNVATEKTENLLDRRVSKYIDNVDGENNDVTLETIVNTTIENEPVMVDKKKIAPKADPELFESQISFADTAKREPQIGQLIPPSPSFDKERPKSDCFLQPPPIPMKVFLGMVDRL